MACSRGGAVLPAVLLIVAGLVIVGTGVVARSGASSYEADAWAEREQSRLAAVSGVRAVMAELGAAKEDLLAGGAVELTEEWVLGEDGTLEWFVRVVGEPEAEAARVPESAVQQGDDESDVGGEPGEVDGEEPEPDRGLDDVSLDDELFDAEEEAGYETTVWSRDSGLQGGIGGSGALSQQGLTRLDVSGEWSEELERAAVERLGEELAEELGSAVRSGRLRTRAGRLSWIVAESRGDWAARRSLFDAIAVWGPADGCFDASRASAAAIEAVLGISGDEVAEVREGVDREDLSTPLWLIENELMTAGELAAIGVAVTGRSLQWRVTIEAGRRSADREGEADDFGILTTSDEIDYPVRLEAVVDVSGKEARLVWMREVVERPADAVADQGFEVEDAADTVDGDPAGPEGTGSGVSFGSGLLGGSR